MKQLEDDHVVVSWKLYKCKIHFGSGFITVFIFYYLFSAYMYPFDQPFFLRVFDKNEQHSYLVAFKKTDWTSYCYHSCMREDKKRVSFRAKNKNNIYFVDAQTRILLEWFLRDGSRKVSLAGHVFFVLPLLSVAYMVRHFGIFYAHWTNIYDFWK